MSGRILLIGPYPPPYGGIASQIQNTVPYLLDAGFECVHILSWSTEDNQKQDGRLALRKVDLKRRSGELLRPGAGAAVAQGFRRSVRHRLPFRRALAETVRLVYTERLVRDGGYDIVHFFMFTEALMAPCLRRLSPQTRLVLTNYGELFDHEAFFGARPELIGEALATVDARMSSSKYCARTVESLGLSSAEIEPLYYGVDLVRFSPDNDPSPVRAKIGARPDTKVVLFFARLIDEMGADTIATIIPSVLDARDDVVFMVAGANGPSVPRLRALAQDYPGRVNLQIDVPNADVPALYAACDVLVAPTRERHACMGMSIKEAMASGRASICSRSGGIPEAVVDGETGILLPTAEDLHVDSGELAQSVLELCAADERRATMAQAARARAEQMFDNAKTAARLVEIYQGLLNRS